MTKITIGALAVIVTVFFGCSKEAEQKIEFLSPYQAASTDTPDGGVDVGIWWLPVRMLPGGKAIDDVTVRVDLEGKSYQVWWIDPKTKVTPSANLKPGEIRMINLVARRAVNDDRAWFGVLLETSLIEQINKKPEDRTEKVRIVPGTDVRITVTVLSATETLGTKDYIVHVPPDKEHNTRFWLQDPSTLNW